MIHSGHTRAKWRGKGPNLPDNDNDIYREPGLSDLPRQAQHVGAFVLSAHADDRRRPLILCVRDETLDVLDVWTRAV